jgi:hypothetical protein
MSAIPRSDVLSAEASRRDAERRNPVVGPTTRFLASLRSLGMTAFTPCRCVRLSF